jgi:DNA-binding NtrC family response regulator
MMVGQSPVLQEVRTLIQRVAATHFTVLIEGESGVGKELVARELHRASPRSAGPFVAVNCAALVESLLEAELFGIEERTATGVRGRRGKFEQANHGTLFLDEIADLSPAAQAKLLRVLQDFTIERVGAHIAHRVNTRVVAATNRNLRELAETGRFRPDLYYRVSGVEIVVPPLRVRRTDIPLLVDHFAGRYRRTRSVTFSRSTLEALAAYDWPGNVRQLARVIEHTLALAPGPVVTVEDLPDVVARRGTSLAAQAVEEGETLRAWSRRYVRLVLDRCGGNKRHACRLLDISYRTLQTYLDQMAAGEGQPMTLCRDEVGEDTEDICERAG